MANRGVARPVVVVTVLRRAHMAMRVVGLAVVDRAAHEGSATTLRDGCARHDGERKQANEHLNQGSHRFTRGVQG
jgi:hypothetical protein